MTEQLRTGMRVRVPWGFEQDRDAVVVDVWGDPERPTQIRVELIPIDDEEEAVRLLLTPNVVTPVHAA